MLETVEATIDQLGRVSLKETLRLDRKRKALVTILDEEPVEVDPEWQLRGSGILLTDDLEAAANRMSNEINEAIEVSANEFRKSLE